MTTPRVPAPSGAGTPASGAPRLWCAAAPVRSPRPPTRRSSGGPTLPGGLRVISEQIPSVRSVAFGIWVGVGSRDETPRLAGSSHFLEHLLFKGTKRRGALEIAAVMDAVGGEMNAFTAKEYTCYYARVLDADLPLAVDVVSDMVTSSVIATADVEAERGVILEEIAMHDDDPGDVVHDAFAAASVRRHAAGPAGARHRRVDHARSRARRSPATTAGATAPATWSSPPPATSTTTRWFAWYARLSAPPDCSRATPRSSRRGPGRQRCADARRRHRHRRPADRAGPRRARRCPACTAATTGGSPWACSTRRSAAA